MKFVLRAFTTDGTPAYWKGGRHWTLDLVEAASFPTEEMAQQTAVILFNAGVIRGGAAGCVAFAPTETVGPT